MLELLLTLFLFAPTVVNAGDVLTHTFEWEGATYNITTYRGMLFQVEQHRTVGNMKQSIVIDPKTTVRIINGKEVLRMSKVTKDGRD